MQLKLRRVVLWREAVPQPGRVGPDAVIRTALNKRMKPLIM